LNKANISTKLYFENIYYLVFHDIFFIFLFLLVYCKFLIKEFYHLALVVSLLILSNIVFNIIEDANVIFVKLHITLASFRLYYHFDRIILRHTTR